MKVVILSTSIINGYARWSELHNNSDDFYCLICNSGKMSSGNFLFRQLHQFIFRSDFKSKTMIIDLIRNGKFKITGENIHSLRTIKWIKRKNFDIGIHGVNVIYKKKLLDCFKYGILNAHLGLLPKYRGKSVVAWSIFENQPTGISTFIIDKGIDTGQKIILSENIDVGQFNNSLKAKKYLSSKTGLMYIKAIRILQDEQFNFLKNDINEGKRYYSMSKLFTDYVDKIMHLKSSEKPTLK